MISTDVSATLAAFLNQISTQDPKFVCELVNHRVPVNNDAIDVVCPADVEPLQAGIIGLVNGFLDSIDQPRISFVEEDDGRIHSFAPLVPAWKEITEDGVTIEVDARLPQVEIDQIHEFARQRLTPIMVNYRARISKLPEGVNMLLFSAPEVDQADMHALRSHIDQATVDKDYSVMCNYEVNVSGRGQARSGS